MRRFLHNFFWLALYVLAFASFSQAQLVLPWSEDFENVGPAKRFNASAFSINGLAGVGFPAPYSWGYFKPLGLEGRLRFNVGAAYANSGTHAATMDDSVNNTTVSPNELILSVDLSSYVTSQINLGFSYMDHGEEQHAGDSVWVRASFIDPWVGVYDLWANRGPLGVYKTVSGINITAALAAKGQTPGQFTQIRFGQMDNGNIISTTSIDGLSIDDVNLSEVAPIDAGVASVNPLTKTCGLFIEPVTISIQNFGTTTLQDVPVALESSSNPGVIIRDTARNLNISAGQTGSFTFSPGVNLAGYGTYTLTAWTELGTDPVTFNDTASRAVTNFTVSSYPFYEDFENGPAGWTTFTDPNSTVPSSWAHGMPALTTINSAASGSYAWLTSQGPGNPGSAGGYSNNEDSWVVAEQCFDMTSLTQPFLRMDVWWNCESGWDGANVQFSVDGGNTWSNVGGVGSGTNWFNNGSITGQPGGAREGWSGRISTNNGSGGWLTAEHPITGLAGQSDVRFRVAFGSDGSVLDDGFAFDNFLIYEKSAIDAGVDSLLDPLPSGCALTSNQVITVRVRNFGTQVLNTIPIGYQVHSGPITGAIVLDTITNANLAAGASANFTFSVNADLSTPGLYGIKSWTTVNNDPNWFNDTLKTTVEHIPVVTVTPGSPYYEDFENGSGGWIPNGPSDPWQFGTPNGSVIRGAASGRNSWATGLTSDYGNNRLGLLESPCFDLSQVLFPLVRMDVWWESYSQSGNWIDGTKVQYSLNGGNTWRDLGTAGRNWYNNPSITTFTNGSTDGWTGYNANGDGSGGWVPVETLAPLLSQQPSVKFRIYFESNAALNNYDGFAIDNIEILEAPDDIANLGMPGSAGCNVTDTICIDVFNGSSATFNSITATYRVGLGATIPQTFNVTLNPGDTRRLCFNRPANFGSTGDYNVFTTISAVGNTVSKNDTFTNRVAYSPVISNYPYFEDFESGSGGWATNSTSFFNSWDLRTPALNQLTSAASGSNCWVTQSGPSTASGYLDNECSWVESPCFDFSTVARPRIRLAVNWYSFTTDGMVLQSSINKGQTWQDVTGTGGINWFSSSNITGITNCQSGATGFGWTGTLSPGWTNTEIIVPTLANEPQVQFRMFFGSDNISNLDGGAFDDFYVDDQPTRDLSTVAILEPRDGTCADQNQDIVVVIRNEGLNTQTAAPIRYSINSQPDIVYNWTGNIAYNEMDTVTIGNFNTFNGGTFNLRVYVDQLIDEQRSNDTTEVTVDITPLPPAPSLPQDTIALCKADSILLWVDNPDSNYTYRWYDPNTGAVVAEGDTIQTTFLARDTSLLVQAVPDGAPIKITECELGADFIEIQNMSNAPFDATGYTVVIAEDFGAPNINQFNPDVWNLGTFNALQVQWRGDVTGANDWGANINWNPLPQEGWAMIISDQCEVVDFVVWGYAVTDLPNLSIPSTVTGCPNNITLSPDDWVGAPFTGTNGNSNLKRVGNSDNNDATDWADDRGSQVDRGLQNPGLILPYSGATGGSGGRCPSPLAQLTILVEPPLNIAVADQFICGPATLDAGPGFNSYLWSTGQNGQTISYNDTVFTASIIVTDKYGCIGYDTAVLASFPFPDLDLGPDTTACGSIKLDGGSPACDYIWSNGSNDRIINFAGRVGVNLVWTECIDPLTGCASRDSINVNLLPLPDAGLPTFMSICDSGSLAVNPAVAGLPLVWSTGDTVPSIDVNTTNRYYVTMTDTATGCVGVDSVDLTVGISPKVDLGDDIVACNSATLDAGLFGGFVFYDWSTTQVTQKITVSKSGSYSVTITDFNQCFDSDTINVDILPPPASDWTAGPSASSITGLDIDFVNLANGIGLTYDWDFGDGTTSSNMDPSHTFQFPGFYIVCLTVTDSCGKSDQYCDTLDLPLMPTSIELEVLENAISIFPTPTKSNLNVEISGLDAEAVLELTDIRGRLLNRVRLPRSAADQIHKIDMSEYAQGVYLLSVMSEGQKVVRKVMKE